MFDYMLCKNTANEDSRIEWLDIAKGIAIITTIIGHTIVGKGRILISSFHMALFFVLAGYTIKRVPCNLLYETVVKDLKRLILPCIIVRFGNALYGVIFRNSNLLDTIISEVKRFLWGNCAEYRYGNYEMLGISGFWFVIALFWSKLAYRIVLEKIEKNRFIFILFGAFISMIISENIWLPQNIDIILLQ